MIKKAYVVNGEASIVFNDGTTLPLKSGDIFDSSLVDVQGNVLAFPVSMSEEELLAEALENATPDEIANILSELEITGAGSEEVPVGEDEGSSVVTVDRTAEEIDPTAGYETIGYAERVAEILETDTAIDINDIFKEDERLESEVFEYIQTKGVTDEGSGGSPVLDHSDNTTDDNTGNSDDTGGDYGGSDGTTPNNDPTNPDSDPDSPSDVGKPKGNKGHGNNTDGQDDDNPGKGSGGPNNKPKDGVDEDEGQKGNQGDITPGVGPHLDDLLTNYGGTDEVIS